jgi:hypothetical protein
MIETLLYGCKIDQPDHMEEVLNRIGEAIDYQYSDECIAEEIEMNEYEYTADGKRYL